MKALLLNVVVASNMNSFAWYVIGLFISLLILIYLIYTLIKPDKF